MLSGVLITRHSKVFQAPVSPNQPSRHSSPRKGWETLAGEGEKLFQQRSPPVSQSISRRLTNPSDFVHEEKSTHYVCSAQVICFPS